MNRSFDFFDEHLPADVCLKGEQVEPFMMEGGLFVGNASYLQIRHGVGAAHLGERLNSYTLLVDVLFLEAPPRQAALFACDGLAAKSIASVHANLVFTDADGAKPEAAKCTAGQFQRLCVTRDAMGAMHYYIDGVYQHTRHNGDGLDVPRSSLDAHVCIFGSAASEHMVGGIIRWFAIYNYALTRADVLSLGSSPF
jgi:hypothetical protein